MSEYFLGIDGGQSGTMAFIGDETGRVLGMGLAGPCNHVKGSGGREKFLNALRVSVAEACAAASISHPAFAAARMGFSGGPDDKVALIGEVLEAKQLSVTHDAAIALDGALAGDAGVIVIAGTGSIAFGCNQSNQEARAGGWGYIFGDEGGAFDIVRQAVRAALRFEEGWGPRTALHGVLLEAVNAERRRVGSGPDLTTANAVLHDLYTEAFPRHIIALWATLVDAIANAGDPIAQEILRGAAQQLAMLATAVRRKLFGDEPSLVSYTGGVFGSQRILETFKTLVELDGTMKITPARYNSAAGALIGAYRLASRTVTLQDALPTK